MDTLRTGFETAWTNLIAFVPKLIGALLILLIGWIIAKIVRNVVARLLGLVRFNEVLGRAGVRTSEGGAFDPKNLLAGLVYWIILLVTFQLTAEALGADTFAVLLAELIAYLPLVLVAVAVVVVALALAQTIAGAIRANVEGDGGDVGAKIAYWSIVAFAVFAAFNVLNLAPAVVNAVLYAALATASLSLIIAFGVGGIPTARQLVAKWANKADRDIDANAGS